MLGADGVPLCNLWSGVVKSKNKKQIKSCRACGSRSLTHAFTIDDIPGARAKRSLLSTKTQSPFVLCDGTHDPHACGLIQSADSRVADSLAANISAADLSDGGGYMVPSAALRTTRSSLRSAATEALELISGRDCAALDIGCSDGTLLSFYPRWVERFGVDRQSVVEEIGDWAWTACGDFPSPQVDRALGNKKFDIVSAISVLEEIDEPRAFLARIKSLLTDDGVLVLETLYAPMTMTRAGVDGIANGANCFYSLGVLERLVRDCDLKIFRGALTEKNGGSIRVFATHAHIEEYDFDPWFERLARLWDEENALSMRSLQPYQAFETRVDEARKLYEALILESAERGDVLHILGTDRAAQLLYDWAGSGQAAIEGAVDYAGRDERLRIGADGPPIISVPEFRSLQANGLIVPFSMKREALETWHDDVMHGLQLLIFGPQPILVNAHNHAVELGKELSAQQSPTSDTSSLRTILQAAGGLRLVSDRSAQMKEAG